MKLIKNKVIVLGSLAFDYIMGFDENFINAVSIDHEKGDYQSTVTVNSRIQHFGGTAGNIAYNLGLLKIAQTSLICSVGGDFEKYKDHITKFKNVNLSVDMHEDLFTAACYIVNDIKSNQMIIFHGGALDKCIDINLKEKIKDPENFIYAINSTQGDEAMYHFAEQLYELKIPMIFDPGQVVPLFTKDLIVKILSMTEILIGNTYEINQILNKAALSKKDILNDVRAIITTKGADGSELIYKDQNEKIYEIDIPICKPEKEIADTTGAGDGYRAGILTGLSLDMTLLNSCRLGSVISSFVIETGGAQTHLFTLEDVKMRFFKTYEYTPRELEKEHL